MCGWMDGWMDIIQAMNTLRSGVRALVRKRARAGLRALSPASTVDNAGASLCAIAVPAAPGARAGPSRSAVVCRLCRPTPVRL